MFDLALLRSGGRPLYEQIADKVEALVHLGTLKPGARLPGSRALAEQWGVSRHTVVAALAELCARGVLQPRGGSGHYVQGRRTPSGGGEPTYNLSSDVPQGALCAVDALQARWSELFQQALQPSPLEGTAAARDALAAHAAGRGITCGPADVWVNGGGRQGLGAVLRALREQGVERLWCGELAWEALPQACDDDGLQLRRFRDLPRNLGPKDAVYLNTDFSNPTGRSLSEEQRREAAALSERRGFWILEDAAYADLRWSGEARLPVRAWSGERVAYLASLSQTFNPGLRVGYALVPAALREDFRAVTARRFGPLSSLLQAWAAEFCRSKAMMQALKTLRSEGARRMSALCAALEISEAERPAGGPYLWLPLEQSGAEFARRARAAGVSVTAGEAFGEPPVRGVRLSIAGCNADALRRAGGLLSGIKEEAAGR